MDFISIDGFEAAGHIGETDITNLILLRRAAQSLTTPFIASGGFADGQGLAAALALGACGINMGTRFMATVESSIHSNIKRAIIAGSEHDTELLLRKWNNTSRLFKNSVTKEAKEIETKNSSSKFEDVAHLVAGQRGKMVFINGDVNAGVSLVLTSIREVPILKFLNHRCGLLALSLVSFKMCRPARSS